MAEKQYLCSRIINPLIITIMTKKLAKNVTRCNEVIRHQKAALAFENFLIRKGVYINFFTAFKKAHRELCKVFVYYSWKMYSKDFAPCQWLLVSIHWDSDIDNGLSWAELHDEWAAYCSANLNK